MLKLLLIAFVEIIILFNDFLLIYIEIILILMRILKFSVIFNLLL